MSETGGLAAKDAMALALKIESTQLKGASKLYPLAMPTVVVRRGGGGEGES